MENTKNTDASARRQAHPIMIQGTMSNAGKSFLAAGLCRIFHEDGFRVAPFKAQNMALNSFITADGKEIGRSQAVQAMAAGVLPEARMNPVLLKPTTGNGSQVILMGEPCGNMEAKAYYREKQRFRPAVEEAYASLAADFDIIVIEGAGSPAEINLREGDFVNMGMAKIADAPVLLVGDIDCGGVFAQLYGTTALLEPSEQERIRGLIINKFRGDISILEPGLQMLEEKTGKPVLGTIPYMDVWMEPEDSLAAQTPADGQREKLLDIAVIRFPKISNTTDFDAFRLEKEVSVRYVKSPAKLGLPDAILLPGTKSTMEDLLWMRKTGLEEAVLLAHAEGSFLMGICGGYQMLGRQIVDEHGAELKGRLSGMGLLPFDTYFSPEKTMRQTKGRTDFGVPAIDGRNYKGYEVHMGQSIPARDEDNAPDIGAIGTYVHGIFDEADFRSAFVEYLKARKSQTDIKDPDDARSGEKISRNYDDYREEQLQKLADTLRAHLDMDAVYRILGLPNTRML